MNTDDSIRLVIRQVKDVQAQADQIIKGNKSDEAFENFSKYAEEMKAFIRKNIPSDEILEYLKSIPTVNYQRSRISIWQYFIFPSWWISLYKDYNQKNKVIEEVQEVQHKYANLELLLKGLTG
jgi:hypothetical protein